MSRRVTRLDRARGARRTLVGDRDGQELVRDIDEALASEDQEGLLSFGNVDGLGAVGEADLAALGEGGDVGLELGAEGLGEGVGRERGGGGGSGEGELGLGTEGGVEGEGVGRECREGCACDECGREVHRGYFWGGER